MLRFAGLPELANIAALAEWLRLTQGELTWFSGALRKSSLESEHYRHCWLPKRSGGQRLLEIPKPRLLRLQHQLLRSLIARVPFGPQVMGFVRGRSCLDHARLHVGAAWLLTLDLKDWFGRITQARISAQFRYLGYSDEVALALARLTTTWTSPSASVTAAEQQFLRTPHLPQGAPTSPALANLVTARFDKRVVGYAAFAGLRYSRYADDIALSPQPGIALAPNRALAAVTRIACSEGFTVNASKTHIHREGSRMQVCGIVVNERLNLDRESYDHLRSAVDHAVRDGLTQAGSPAALALQGRLSWYAQLNPRRAAPLIRKLRDALDTARG